MQGKTEIIKSIFLSKMKKQPYKLNFAVTSACNSRCKTCDVWKVFQRNPEIIKDDLSLREIELIFKNLPSNFVWLSLSGGEPFLRKDLVDICQAAVENIPSLGLISIPSNGLLTKEILGKTEKTLSLSLKNLFLNFSIDGPEKIHDEVRGIKDGFKKTWATYEKILALSQREPRLSVNLETTISKYNFNYIENFFKELVADGHKITVTIAHTGYLYKNTEGDKEFTRLDNDGGKLKTIIEIVKKSLNFTSPVDLIERIYLSQILKFYENPRRQPLPCIALENSLSLDQKGNIIPCFMWGKILGNIRDFDYNLKKFLKEKREEIKATRKLIRKEKCPNCWTPCEAYQSIINSFLSSRLVGLINSLVRR